MITLIQALITSGNSVWRKVLEPPYNFGEGMVYRLYFVTRPKLFPPPRRAQYRSGYEVALAVTIRPLAVTTYM